MDKHKPRPPLNTAIVADDDDLTREIVKLALMSLGITIIGEAGTGRQTAELVRTLRPSLTCLDLNMPDGTGLDALKLIREFDSDVVLVMISSRTDPRDRHRAIQLGADTYLTKPLNREDLEAELRLLGVLP